MNVTERRQIYGSNETKQSKQQQKNPNFFLYALLMLSNERSDKRPAMMLYAFVITIPNPRLLTHTLVF